MKPCKVFYVFLLWLKIVFKTIVTNATKIKMRIDKEREKKEGGEFEGEWIHVYV